MSERRWGKEMRMRAFRRNADLLAAMGIALVAALADLTESGGTARVGLSLLLVLVAPGYVAAAALFPADTLQRVERLVASLGLSLAIAILGGIALNLTPWGLQTSAWAYLLACVTVCMGGVAFARRHSYTRRDAAKQSANLRRFGLPPLPSAAQTRRSGHLTTPQILMLCAALLITVGAVAIAANGQQQANAVEDATATQLWIQPVTQSDISTIQIGMTNRLPGVTPFQLILTSQGVTVHRWNLTLHADATWQTTVVLSRAELAARSIQAALFRASDLRTPYRQVTLSLSSAGLSGARPLGACPPYLLMSLPPSPNARLGEQTFETGAA